MNSRHFIRKGDKDNEEVYQIYGPCFDSKDNQHPSSLISSATYDKIIETEEENRFCHIILECKDNNSNINMDEKVKTKKEIKVDYFQLARLSRKLQKVKQICIFPFIKRFKFDIKANKEDTFLEFIKSTQGEEFKITEKNYNELYEISTEWGTYELTSILKDYGQRHDNSIDHIIQQYLYLTNKYEQQKEEKITRQRIQEKVIKIKFGQIKILEEKIKNRISECFKNNFFWEIRIETIHRLISEALKEGNSKDYSQNSLIESILESIEEREKLIDLIDPYKITEANHKILVDLQYKMIKDYNNKKPNSEQNNKYINTKLILELLQSYQESDKNENNQFPNKSRTEEMNKLKRELAEKGKENEELKEREKNFFNEIGNIKRKEKEINIRENDVENQKIKNQTREEENTRREEENTKREEENARREKENARREKENKANEEKNEIREKEVQKREKKIEENENYLENIKIIFAKKMKEDEEKIRVKEKQQQQLIVKLENKVKQYEEKEELETFLRENNLESIDDIDEEGYEAIHLACRNGNDQIVSYILSKNPNKLNVKEVFFYFI